MTTRVRVLIVLVLVLLAGACAGSQESGGAPSGGGDEAMTEPTAAADAVAAGESAGGGGTSAAPTASAVDLQAVSEGRQIISTGDIRLRVEDLNEAVDRATELVERFGGLVFDQHTDLREEARTQLTLRVPPGHFHDLLDGLADLGDVQTVTVQTDDVTEQVVDLDARIRTAEVSVARLRELIDRAEAVDDIARIETELLNRETTLEQLRGQQRTLQQQISLATVTASFRAERIEPPPPPPPPEHRPGFMAGLRRGAHALWATAIAGSAGIGLLIPWLPVVAVLYLGWRLVLAARTRGAARPAAPRTG